MGRKKIREIDAKRLLQNNLPSTLPVKFQNVQVTTATSFDLLLRENDWLSTTRLVVKPDMLFGQRGKNNLVLINADFPEARAFLEERLNKTIEHNNTKGTLTHFIIERFVPHTVEYYVSLVSNREETVISFSSQGGINIEENWESLSTLSLPVSDQLTEQDINSKLLSHLPAHRDKISAFISALFKVFEDLDFTLLEMNPFTIDESGQLAVLDIRAELDGTAHFKNVKKWGQLEFPAPFGSKITAEESFINGLDEKSGASLKLTILNPEGRIWTLVAGGGASVIFADTVADLGFGHELGNYGEYSGAPNEEETFHYARTLLSLATRNPDGRPRLLLIGGGIANFTDVAKTFRGIIHALKEFKEQLKAAKVSIFVRRAGPNYESGLRAMRQVGKEIDVPIDVYGPEVPMTSIIPKAIRLLAEPVVATTCS